MNSIDKVRTQRARKSRLCIRVIDRNYDCVSVSVRNRLRKCISVRARSSPWVPRGIVSNSAGIQLDQQEWRWRWGMRVVLTLLPA